MLMVKYLKMIRNKIKMPSPDLKHKKLKTMS